MNLLLVARFIGFLLCAEAVFMLPCTLVSLIYGGEAHVIQAILYAVLIALAAGGLLLLAGRKAKGAVYSRESFVIAGIGWLLVSLIGALPFFLSGEMRFFDAFFESVAGFTTTGTFIYQDIEAWPRGLLFWRNFTQWLGGIGVLTFILALIRGQQGSSLNLFKAESPGPQVGKILPKTRESVQSIYIVYLGLSALALIFLLLGGMPVFEALCTMFGVAGTGGLGVKNDSMASYSGYLQLVCTIFMMLFGTNFALYHLMLRERGGLKMVLKNEEIRVYFGLFFGSVLLIGLGLFFGGYYGLGQSLHNSAFMSASVMTSTGLSIADYSHWPGFARSLLFVLMIIGSMGGSTGGGFKVGRLLILWKSFRAGIHKLTHPRSVTSVRINGKPVGEETLQKTQLFLFLYCAVILTAFLLISVDDFPPENNLTAVIACINNIGPGFGLVTSMASFGDYSIFSKMVLALCMLVGRLEIFPIVLLLVPATWKIKA